MNRKLGIVSALLAGSMIFMNAARADDTLFGAVLGGGAGVLVGHAVGGRDGAIVGGALGAVAGAVIAADDDDDRRGGRRVLRPRLRAATQGRGIRAANGRRAPHRALRRAPR